MQTASLYDSDWSSVAGLISGSLDLAETARRSKAFVRARGVPDAVSLLRLAFAYGISPLSLRGTAAWAESAGVASVCDVSLLARLRNASDWLEEIWQTLLVERLSGLAIPNLDRVVRLVDATSISAPGSAGTDWRLHMEYRPAEGRFAGALLSDGRRAEGFRHFTFGKGDLALGDRAYAKAKDLAQVAAAEADFLVRIGWRSVVLLHADGQPLDILALLAGLPPDRVTEIPVQIADGAKHRRPIVAARLILQPLPPETAERSRRRATRKAKRQGRTVLAQGAIAAGWMMLLTTLPAEAANSDQVLALYRLRWQIELAFKRLKSLLHIDRLAAKDPRLARCWLAANLIAALLIDRMSQDFLDSPPSAVG